MIFHLHRRWNNAAHTCYPGLFLWIVSNRRFEEFETIQSKSPHIRILNDRVQTSLLLSRGPSIHLLTNIQAMTAGTAKMQVIAISQPIPLAQPKQDQKSVFISKQTRRAQILPSGWRRVNTKSQTPSGYPADIHRSDGKIPGQVYKDTYRCLAERYSYLDTCNFPC